MRGAADAVGLDRTSPDDARYAGNAGITETGMPNSGISAKGWRYGRARHPGQVVPQEAGMSVRQSAGMLQVSAAEVQRTRKPRGGSHMEPLREAGLITSVHGRGTFITPPK